MESGQKTEKKIWFAMRATYRREMIAKRALEERQVESFVPMCYELKVQGGRRRRALVPAIHNLIFVYCEPKRLQAVKTSLPYLQYIIRKGGEKIVVPDDQMQRFIAVTNTYDEELTFYNPEELNLSVGQRVRVLAGNCEGQEGILIKVPGRRTRRVVVAIEGVMAVALATIRPDQLEVIG
ncbi:MAG: UpxY family transcription antiterminator [Rikenellaceae bacterium]|nr:UpxY family transcription antiterminator [Rikenellaceae bacterium]